MPVEQITFGGIYLPVFLVFLAAAGGFYLVLHLLLQWLRVHRLFWHPALAEAGLFVLVLSVIMLLFGP